MVEWSAGLDGDGATVIAIVQRSLDAIDHEFQSSGGAALWDNTTCRIHEYGSPNAMAGEGRALLQTSCDTNGCTADIHLLAPSRHSPSATTMIGEPMDLEYIAKTLTHELASVALEQITRRKEGGWHFYSAPSWFVQGYEEYLGLALSSQHNRVHVFEKYKESVRQNPAHVSLGATVAVANPYLDGAVVLAFLHHRFGKIAIHTLLQSRATDFESAFAAVVGERALLQPAFSAWLK